MNYFDARGITENLYDNYVMPNYLKNIILENLDSHILDFGCGYGQNLSAIHKILKERGGGVKGIDINPKAIQYCQNKKLEAFVIEDIFSYFPKTKFDIIVMSHVLEHFSKEKIIPLLKHFYENFLSERGKLIIAVPNAQSNTGCYWAYEDFTHSTLFTSGSLAYVLKMAGFTNLKFLDPDCLEDTKRIQRLIRKIFLKIYKTNIYFWNKVTCSSFHLQSPSIFSYELKILAQKN